MQHTIVAILLLLIIVLAGWLIAFNSFVTKKKVLIDDAWDQISSLFLDRNELLEKLVQRASMASSWRGKAEVLMQAKHSFMEAKTTDRLIRSSRELSNQVQSLQLPFDTHPNKDEDPVSAGLLLQLAELEVKLNGKLELYQVMSVRYNSRLKVFPNNLAAVILGTKPLG